MLVSLINYVHLAARSIGNLYQIENMVVSLNNKLMYAQQPVIKQKIIANDGQLKFLLSTDDFHCKYSVSKCKGSV